MFKCKQILKVRDVVVTKGARDRMGSFILGPVSLDVESGETLAIVGFSGAGKSTMLRVMIGMEVLQRGDVLLSFDGEDISLAAANGKLRKKLLSQIGFVNQDPSGSLNPLRSIVDQIKDPMVIHNLCRNGEMDERAIHELELVGIPPEMADKLPGQLSGGQRQRVAIARSLVHRPKIVFLDEPTSSLDPSVQAEVMQVLRNRHTPDMSFVLVTHDLGVVRSLADRIAVISNGKIVEVGEVEACFTHPQSVEFHNMLSAAMFGNS